MRNEQNTPDYLNYLKIPVIVGVTGHVDIADDEKQIQVAMKSFWVHPAFVTGSRRGPPRGQISSGGRGLLCRPPVPARGL